MSQAPARREEESSEWTTVGVRPVLYSSGSHRMTLTPAQDELDLTEGEKYVIKTRDDGSILLVPQ